LERVQFAELRPAGSCIPDPLVGLVRQDLLGVEALGGVELDLEPLSLLGYPPRVDSFVLRIGPAVRAPVHLMSCALQSRLDVVITPGVVVRLEAACEAQSIGNLPQDCRR